MFARVALVTERESGVLALPSAALLPDVDPAVLLLGDGGLRKVPVKLGLRTADLREGDRVTAAGG